MGSFKLTEVNYSVFLQFTIEPGKEQITPQQTAPNTVKQQSVTTQYSDSLDERHRIYILVNVFALECGRSANNPQDGKTIHNGVFVAPLVLMDA